MLRLNCFPQAYCPRERVPTQALLKELPAITEREAIPALVDHRVAQCATTETGNNAEVMDFPAITSRLAVGSRPASNLLWRENGRIRVFRPDKFSRNLTRVFSIPLVLDRLNSI